MKHMLKVCLVMHFASVVHGSICCTPRQWEACQYGFGNLLRPGSLESTKFSYDADKKKIAVAGTSETDGVKTVFKIIDDFSSGTRYLIEPEDKACTVFHNIGTVFTNYCVPDYATTVGRSYVGIGGETLKVVGYRFGRQWDLYDIDLFVVVTQDDCIPLSEDTRGTFNNTNYREIRNYAQIQSGIDDTNVFDPPDYCQGSTN